MKARLPLPHQLTRHNISKSSSTSNPSSCRRRLRPAKCSTGSDSKLRASWTVGLRERSCETVPFLLYRTHSPRKVCHGKSSAIPIAPKHSESRQNSARSARRPSFVFKYLFLPKKSAYRSKPMIRNRRTSSPPNPTANTLPQTAAQHTKPDSLSAARC
jgi:membrane carboxypeptidase/penicillin-binding protein PbpC